MKTTAIFPMDGEWTVKIYDALSGNPIQDTNIAFVASKNKLDTTINSYYTMYTSNTATNDNNMLVLRTFNVVFRDTFPNQKDSKSKNNVNAIIGKVHCNVSNKTFSIIDGQTSNKKAFSISDGKVLLNAAHPPSGVKTDSIIFFISKFDTITTQYRVEGFRRTYWEDDENW